MLYFLALHFLGHVVKMRNVGLEKYLLNVGNSIGVTSLQFTAFKLRNQVCEYFNGKRSYCHDRDALPCVH